MVVMNLILLSIFNSFLINIIIIIFAIFTVSLFESNNKLIKVVKGIITSLFIGLLMLNPIILSNGVYYDGKIVLITVLGLFSGGISTITSLVLSIPLRYLITETGNPLVSVFMMLSSGFLSLITNQIIKKHKNKNLRLLAYLITISLISIINVLIFLNLNESDAKFKNMFIPFLVIFPLITIIISIIYTYKLSYNKIVKENSLKRKILSNAVDINDNIGYLTVNKDYEYLLFNNFHAKYILDKFNTEINVGDQYLNLLKSMNLDTKVRENIDKAFTGTSFEDTFRSNEVVYKQKYNPIYNRKKVIAVNILSKDITEKIKK